MRDFMWKGNLSLSNLCILYNSLSHPPPPPTPNPTQYSLQCSPLSIPGPRRSQRLSWLRPSGTCRGRRGSPLCHTHPADHWSIQQHLFTNQQLSRPCRGRRGSPLCHTHPHTIGQYSSIDLRISSCLGLAEGGEVVHCVIHILHTIGQYSSRDLTITAVWDLPRRRGIPLCHTHPAHHWSIQQHWFTNQQLSRPCWGRRGSPLCHTHPAHHWSIQQHWFMNQQLSRPCQGRRGSPPCHTVPAHHWSI